MFDKAQTCYSDNRINPLKRLTLKKLLKKLAKRIGFDVKRITPATSDALRTSILCDHHHIDLVLDVGANIGLYASELREAGYTGKIVSFEPLSSAYTVLRNASLDDPLWKVADRIAIGNFDGEIEINIAGNSTSSSVMGMLDSHTSAAPYSAYVGSELVPIRKLDTLEKDYMENANSIFLKIDVQGFEKQVLEGASALLPRIKGLQLELSLVPLYEGQALSKEIIEQMEQLGFEIYAIYPGFSDMETGRMLQMDGVFFR